jgi:23S rRNA pseudouridine2605 synthase
MPERLQKLLSAAGVASRRAAEALIRAGRVTVNGTPVTELGARADPDRDVIAVDGEVLQAAPRRTIVLHKPRGVVTTLADPRGRATVGDLVRELPTRLYPVGRLDLQTAGLLLLTNDGALAAGLLHPRRRVERVYHAKVRGSPAPAALRRLLAGVRLEDGPAAVAAVRVVARLPTKTWLAVTVREGRHHLVRRLCAAIGHPVEKLVRVRFGPLRLGHLPPGAWRDLTPAELAALRAAAGLPATASAAAAPREREQRPRRSSPPRGRPPRGARARAAASAAGAPPRARGRPRPRRAP